MYKSDFLCPILAKGQTCTPCEELAAMIDQETSPLNAKRTLIYGHMNYAHDPLTSKLPAEIVGKIFTNFLPVDVDSAYGVSVKRPVHHSVTNPLSLGAVCAAWRAIAWSTPQLWTSISVCLTYINEARRNIAHDWLCRSGEHPLYVNIYQVSYTNDKAGSEKILNLFKRQCHRWFYLEYNIEAKYDLHLQSESAFARARILNTLKIGNASTSRINLGMTPNLRNLFMARPCIEFLSGVDWQQLTNLEGMFNSITMCSWVFSNAPNLKRCTFSIHSLIFFGETAQLETGNTVHQHDHLLFLHIKKWNTDTDASLHLLQFPALQHLTIDSNEGVDVATIADFLRRSNCSLKILDLDIEDRTPEDILN